MDRAVKACIDDARADHERQGGLDDQDVARLISAHRLDEEQAGEVRAGLDESGLIDLAAGDVELAVENERATRDDAIGALLRRARDFPLLTREEETWLGARVARGKQAEEEASLGSAKVVADGRAAHQRLVCCNLRLAFSIALRFQNRGLELEDIFHEALLGTMRAADKFDHEKGFKFSTYATWWITQFITRALADKGRTIRLPVHVVERLNRVHRIQRELQRTLQRAPTTAELAAELNAEPAEIQGLLDIDFVVGSLDAFVGDDGSSSRVLDFFVSTAPSLEEEVELRWRDAEIRRRLALLENSSRGRAAEVLRRRHGIDREGPQTLDEIGAHFGVTRERIRQIESKAISQAQEWAFKEMRNA